MSKGFKFAILFFVSSVLVSCNLYSGTVFNLTVLDENKDPVQNAEINGSCGNGNIKGKTDENGKFSSKVDCIFDEGVSIYVKKDAYLEYHEGHGVTDILEYNQFKDKRIILKKK